MKEYLLVCNILFFARNFLNEHTVTWNFYYFSFSSFLFLIIIIIIFSFWDYIIFPSLFSNSAIYLFLVSCMYSCESWVSMHACVEVPTESRKTRQVPCKAYYSKLCASWYGFWEMNSGRPQEQYVHLTNGHLFSFLILFAVSFIHWEGIKIFI